jgi:hypothetical protein
MKNEIIIDCGVEGDSWTLVGAKGPNGWRFRASRDEGTLLDFMTEADAADFEPRSESEWVGSWEAALILFDRYPWHLYYPVRIPISQARFGLAAQARFNADKHHKNEMWVYHTFQSWLRLCHRGGPTAA